MTLKELFSPPSRPMPPGISFPMNEPGMKAGGGSPLCPMWTKPTRTTFSLSAGRKVCWLLDHYPEPVIHTLMNSLSTHDTVRAITCLGVDHPVPSDQQGDYGLSPKEYERGKKLFQMASMLQYTLPGFPCLYYGDEAGLDGFADPWNRRCYPWGREDEALIGFFRQLGNIRKEFAKAFRGEFRFVAAADSLAAFVRGGMVLTAVNRGQQDAFMAVKGQKILAVVGECTLEEHSIRIGPDSGAIVQIKAACHS